MKSNEVFLRHVLDEITLLEHTRRLSFDDFMEDAVLKRACARSFEIIGEAVKNISTDFRRKHKEIDWKNIAGMRDKLIHQYPHPIFSLSCLIPVLAEGDPPQVFT
jgi:uncharacterized protein with HEPN domain